VKKAVCFDSIHHSLATFGHHAIFRDMVQRAGPGSKRASISGKNPSNCKREKEYSELPPIPSENKNLKVTFQMITFVTIWN
jgi:hypothetical protein